jgi:Ca-activated chloride channel family protein
MGRVRIAVLTWMLVAGLPAAGAAQGWIEPPGGIDRSGFVVDKVRSEVHVSLDGRVAHVEVSEWFRNEGKRAAEGHYLYPLPGEAVFQAFSLFLGDAELRGEIMDAERARAVYEDIVRRRADPALIELAGEGLLRARIFPIEPGEERRVTLRYTQVLARAGDALQFVYAGAVKGGLRRPAGAEPAEVVGSAPQEPVRTIFEVVADDGDAYLDPFSPTHGLEVRRDGGRLTVGLRDQLHGRLSIFLPLAGEAVGLSVATHRLPGEDGYFMLTLSPGRNAGRAEPRDVTVVLDVSGSMSGEKIAQAKGALHGLLATLEADDRFRLVAFSNAVRMLDTEWSSPTRAGLTEARRWVDALVADGGTNIGAALDEAFRMASPDARLPVVLFLTDGLPSVGEMAPERLADRAEARAGRARVFAFGVGHDVNTHLLDRLGEAGRGSTQYVEPGENVERALGLLATKVRHPVLTDLEIAGAPVRLEEIYPVRIPDVFAGEELVLFGRYGSEGEGRLRLRGTRSGGTETFAVGADFPRTTDANGYIPRLWASRKLGHLTRQIWTEGETPGLVAEIRELALRYGLPSAYTSYLVQESDVVADRPIPAGGVPGRTDQGSMFLPSAPSMPSAASGADAVRRAREAGQMREAKSVAALAETEDEMAAGMVLNASGTTLAEGGRIFRLSDGVWIDLAHVDGAAVFQVKAFSAAYFRVLKALPELRPVLARASSVIVAGAEVSLQVGDEGIGELSDAALAGVVSRFRGARGAP